MPIVIDGCAVFPATKHAVLLCYFISDVDVLVLNVSVLNFHLYLLAISNLYPTKYSSSIGTAMNEMQLSNTQPQSSPVGIVSFITTSPSRFSNLSTISSEEITILHWRYFSFNLDLMSYRNSTIPGSTLPSVFRRDLLTVNSRTNWPFIAIPF